MENVELVTNQNGGIAILLVNRRILEIRIRPKRRIGRTRAHPRLGIGADPLLKEVVLALHADALHEIKGIGRLEGLAVAELGQEAVGDKLNVLPHELLVHANEVAREGLGNELLLNGHGLSDNAMDLVGLDLVDNLLVEFGGKVRVEPLVPGNEFIARRQAGHQAPLLDPEDGAEGAAEEDALDHGKPNEAGGKVFFRRLDPAPGPVGLLADARNRLNGPKGLEFEALSSMYVSIRRE